MRWDLLVGVFAYIVLMLVIGRIAGSKVASTGDYVLAGKKLPWWLATASLFATWFGAETCMGAAGAARDEGLLGVIEDPLGAALCLLLLGIFFAKPLSRLNVLTISDYFKN